MLLKQRLLYASPFWPINSGISDYSEILLYGLKEYFAVTLLTDDYKVENKEIKNTFKILKYKKDDIDFNEYDHIIYNIGNNPYFHSYMYECIMNHPGIIILHDYVLYYLTVGYYMSKGNLYSKIFELEGAKGIDIVKKSLKGSNNNNLLEHKSIANLLPLNKEIIENSKGVIVHSEFTKKLVQTKYKNARTLKINMVNMNEGFEKFSDSNYLKNKYNIDHNAFVIGSFGYIAPTKLNHIICEVIKKINLKTDNKIYYVMVGEGDYIDEYLDKYIIKTGFLKKEDYNSVLKRCNVISNLRYPTMGETSISLIHAMGLGKACLVTDDAWFSELPDDVVVKINNGNAKEELYCSILDFRNNEEKLATISQKAKAHIKEEYAIKKISKEIFNFI